MNRIDAADDAEYNRVQSALAERAVAARQETQNQHMADKMAGVDAADNFIPLSEMACVVEPERPRTWWQQIGDFFMPQSDYAVTIADGVSDANKVRNVVFTPQENGNFSVSAPDVPSGTRINYFNEDVLPAYELPPGVITGLTQLLPERRQAY